MSYSADDPHFVYIPLDQIVTEPDGLCQVVRNAYWAVHPERGLVFWKRSTASDLIPQYNSDKRVSDMIVPSQYPWAEVRQIPIVVLQVP